MFPAIGGYCKGIVCQWSVPIQYSFATTLLLIGLIGFAISICILYRHQSLVRGTFKLSKVTYLISFLIRTRFQKSIIVLRTFLLIICTSSGITSFCVFFDKSKTEELIDKYEYGNLSWIRERGMYSMFVRSRGTTIVVPVVAISSCLTPTQDLFSEVCQVAYYSLYPHSLVHSLVLLFITPSYRRMIGRCICRAFRREV
ncbi:hypothetical protein PMAYCL1PPCAC_17495, partial [Pristionchus mayeri]